MKISVVTVCYNAVSTLEETMLSVLNQTYSNVEYIVIDGGSTDGTVDIIKKYADRLAYWISEPDKGIYDAMNKGIALATGDYINFMNSGDIFLNNTIIYNLFNDIKTISNHEIIYGRWLIKFNEHKIVMGKPKSLDIMWKGSCLCHQASFIKLKRLKYIKYNSKYKIAADYEYFMNAYNNIPNSFLYVPEVICRYNANGCSYINRISSLKEMQKISLSYKKSNIHKLYFLLRITLEKTKILIKQWLNLH